MIGNDTSESKKAHHFSVMSLFKCGGGGEIWTLGELLTLAGFQDQCIQPLCHPSAERDE